MITTSKYRKITCKYEGLRTKLHEKLIKYEAKWHLKRLQNETRIVLQKVPQNIINYRYIKQKQNGII